MRLLCWRGDGGIGEKKERSAIDLIGSFRSLHLCFHYSVHIGDKNEGCVKRNSVIILYITPEPKSVLLFSKGMRIREE